MSIYTELNHSDTHEREHKIASIEKGGWRCDFLTISTQLVGKHKSERFLGSF